MSTAVTIQRWGPQRIVNRDLHGGEVVLTSDDEAVKNALSKLSSQDRRLADFIKTAKSKIVDYYQRNLSSVISRAHAFGNIQQYGEGLALLFSCPTAINGYANINKEIASIYRQYQTQECSNTMQKARAEYANGNYKAATEYLQQIDMTSSCATEAKKNYVQISNSRKMRKRSKPLNVWKDKLSVKRI